MHRIFTVFKSWIDHHWHDWSGDEDMITAFQQWLSAPHIVEGMTEKLSTRLKDDIDRRRGMRPLSSRHNGATKKVMLESIC